MSFLRVILAALTVCLCASQALAQGALLQGGPWSSGHVPMYVGPGGNFGQAILQDSGPASGGAVGLGLTELLLQERGGGVSGFAQTMPPYANAGTGPFATNLCDFDGPTTGPYHYLCLSPNAQGGGLLAYGSAGGATALPLTFEVNGIAYPFPFAGNQLLPLFPNGINQPGIAVDLRQYGAICDGVATNTTALNNAVTAGYKTVFLPAGCLLQVTNDVTPAGVRIIGGDWNTSIIAVSNRATTALQVGPNGRLENVGIISQWCDLNANPQGVQKVCPLGQFTNIGDSPIVEANWVYEGITLFTSPVTVNGIHSTDLPSLAVECFGTGDCIFVGTGATSTSGIRIATTAEDDQGIFLIDGQGSPSNAHWGIFIKELSQNTSEGKASLYIDRAAAAGGVSQSFLVQDNDSGGNNTSPVIDMVTSHQTAGAYFNVFGTGGVTYTGNAISLNLGNGVGGNFTGKFLVLQNAGTNELLVDNAGNINEAGYFSVGTNETDWLEIHGAATNPYILSVGADTDVNLKLASKGAGAVIVNGGGGGTGGLDVAAGHIHAIGQTAPSLSACGTSPSLYSLSTDIYGLLTEGTSATGCAVTFTQAYLNNPVCVVSSPGGDVFTGYSTSTTALTITNGSASGYTFSYVCMGD